MKTILVICSNIIVALQIKTHYSKNKDINNKYIFLVEKNNSTKEVIKVFNSYKNKEIHKLNAIKKPIYFSLTKFYDFYKIKKHNNQLQQELKKFKNINIFLKNQYSEICFSNDNFSKLILYKKNIAKKYFSHSFTDFLIHRKYLNFYVNIKRKFEDFINNNFLDVYKPSSDNAKIYCIFNYFRKKKLLFTVDINKFKEIFVKNINFRKKKFLKNKEINLINISIPYSYYKKRYPIKVLYNYVDYFQNGILRKILKKSKEVYILKFKENIPINIRKKIIKKFQKNFKSFIIILYTKKITGTNSLEQFVYSYNVKNYFSNFSSSMFLVKLIKPKITIYNFSDRIDNYWKHKQELLFEYHRQNQSNLLKLINKYKKIWKNL